MPAFDKRISDFEAADTQVLGISTDSPFSHENWARSVGISHYPLLSDIHRTASKAYGVYWPEWNANLRATFVVDRAGIVRFIERYDRGQLPDPHRMLAEVKKIPEEGRLTPPTRPRVRAVRVSHRPTRPRARQYACHASRESGG